MSHLTCSNGRQIHYECSGPVDADAQVLVFHHGTPGAALLWDQLVKAAQTFSWRVVMLSRPGYATSGRQPGRSVADAASDVGLVLDHLGAGSFVASGWSGGGPHALACGALLAPRCAAVATIAGVAPYYGVTDLEWTAGMGPENVEEFHALMKGDPGLEGRLAEEMKSLAGIQPDQLVETLGGLLSEPDRVVLEGESAGFFAAWFRLAASGGSNGYWDDDQAFMAPWGFDLAPITVPVSVWWADQDLMVPASHGAWLASHIPTADAVPIDGEGHVSLLTRYIDDIVARLAFDAGLK
jgi:pimeloyl-ACP methyl ester carboxylesterase